LEKSHVILTFFLADFYIKVEIKALFGCLDERGEKVFG